MPRRLRAAATTTTASHSQEASTTAAPLMSMVGATKATAPAPEGFRHNADVFIPFSHGLMKCVGKRLAYAPSSARSCSAFEGAQRRIREGTERKERDARGCWTWQLTSEASWTSFSLPCTRLSKWRWRLAPGRGTRGAYDNRTVVCPPPPRKLYYTISFAPMSPKPCR